MRLEKEMEVRRNSKRRGKGVVESEDRIWKDLYRKLLVEMG